MDAKIFDKIKKAIKIGSLNLDKHANGDWFNWHSHTLLIEPLFMAMGRQIGYSISIKGQKGEIQCDFDLKKIEIA